MVMRLHRWFIILAAMMLYIVPSTLLALEDFSQKQGLTATPLRNRSLAATNEVSGRTVLAVTPRECDLGDIGLDDVTHGLLVLKNLGGGDLSWSTTGPEGWDKIENQELGGLFTTNLEYLRLSIKSSISDGIHPVEKSQQKMHFLQITLEAGGKMLVLRRALAVGTYRDPLKITSSGGVRTVFINFRIREGKPELQLDVEPLRIDFGSVMPGKQLVKQVKITNKGKESIRWRFLQHRRPEDNKTLLSPLKGRYVSLSSDDMKDSGNYVPPGHLRDSLEVGGNWVEYEGRPSAYGINNVLRWKFSGTGVGVFFRRVPDGGQVAAYVDDQLIHVFDSNGMERGTEELPIIDGLPEGQHLLTLINGEGHIIIEGISIYGKGLQKGNPGWISIAPDSGTTTRETDYANIRIDTQQLAPGQYGEQLILATNQGDIVLEAYVEVRSDQVPKYLDVYRYVRSNNYLYTSNPQGEVNRIKDGRYRKEGIAFRLFPPGSPGTTEFYRWYSTKKDDHYYTYVKSDNVPFLKDYVLEGSIGNIGTIRLAGTRELYRWRHAETGCHFYTTDEKGEGIAKRGYQFDGIAGYVR